MNVVSKIDRVYKAFIDGHAMTAKQIAARFSVKNPYDCVHRLRNEGHNIVLRPKTDTKGRTNFFYSLSLSRRAA